MDKKEDTFRCRKWYLSTNENNNQKKGIFSMSLLELFCDVDDFYQEFCVHWEKQLLTNGNRQRQRKTQMTMSEMMTIMIQFHQSSYRTFKDYYTKHVQIYQRGEFPRLVSYERFVALMPRLGIPLTVYLKTRMGDCTGISFVDATSLRVCHNKRIPRHRVFEDFAERGKTTMGWFYGFKLHLIVSDQGEILAYHISPGNVDDREPVGQMSRDIFGKVFGDKGYISQALFETLFAQGIQLITMVRKNMKNRLVPLADKLLSRKRSIIETINDQLKNISQIDHSRHRSVNNFFVNLIAGLIAYCLQDKKPSLNLSPDESSLLGL